MLGDGDVTVDAPTFSISYTATAEGVSRVVYALEGDIAGVPDIKMGTLDYAVSDSLNNAPTAANFSYGSDVEINTSVDIDVIDAISDAVDLDELQLIEVKSYTANVASKNVGDLTNTVFTFEAPTADEHYVSYMVSDHRGGFATGIVEVTTFDANQVAQWGDIEEGLKLFTAPHTKFTAESNGIDIQGFWRDSAYSPSIDVATFTLAGAVNYCSTRGRLPTPAELVDMHAAKSAKVNYLWPTGKPYITEEAGTATLVDLSWATAQQSAAGGDSYYVTCIDSGGLTFTGSSSAVADGVSTAALAIDFTRVTGPVVDASLTVSVTGSASLSTSVLITDTRGNDDFTLTNTKAELVTVSVEYITAQNETVTTVTTVDFTADASTAALNSLTVTNDNAGSDGSMTNGFNATVVDAYNNALKNILIDVSFDGVTPQLVEFPSALITDASGNISFNVTNTVEESVLTTASLTNSQGVYSEQSASTNFVELLPWGRSCADLVLSTNGLDYHCPMTSSEQVAYWGQGKSKGADYYGASWGLFNMDDSISSISGANAYCSLLGASLATKDELVTFNDTFGTTAPENDTDGYGDLHALNGWPYGQFWSSTSAGTGTFYGFDTVTDTVTSFADTNRNSLKVICVTPTPGNPATAMVDSITALTSLARADGIATNSFEVLVLDDTGKMVKDALVEVTFTGSATLVETAQSLLTNAQGLVQFNVVNTVEEDVTVTAQYVASIAGLSSVDSLSSFTALSFEVVAMTGALMNSTESDEFCGVSGGVVASREQYEEYFGYYAPVDVLLLMFPELETIPGNDGLQYVVMAHHRQPVLQNYEAFPVNPTNSNVDIYYHNKMAYSLTSVREIKATLCVQ
ncbi:hypothetical protein FM037_13340 [Shewanella psychropiezotolerans]|uniref:Big-1 domain-containing protein n=1 Tax=Shewanella psychropiezotolerans TaxID=2593655 RepID=A0ABX5WY55_9GAMM|nr:Ig-like domain-containing protein [Shewanella psychropiezotolerans]QDO84042.1 hypothetical protein FM037_13340 [Shewanella psychropiezotolerans]